jgi:cytochrome bd-type quinol oxidase subunit 2
MSIIAILAFIVILGALAAAGYFMLRASNFQEGTEDEMRAKNNRMARALAVRIGVSVALFIAVLVAWKLGYIQPSGLPVAK